MNIGLELISLENVNIYVYMNLQQSLISHPYQWCAYPIHMYYNHPLYIYITFKQKYSYRIDIDFKYLIKHSTT